MNVIESLSSGENFQDYKQENIRHNFRLGFQNPSGSNRCWLKASLQLLTAMYLLQGAQIRG